MTTALGNWVGVGVAVGTGVSVAIVVAVGTGVPVAIAVRVAVDIAVGASAVSVAAIALASATLVATRSGVGVASVRPQPDKSSAANVRPIMCCRISRWFIYFVQLKPSSICAGPANGQAHPRGGDNRSTLVLLRTLIGASIRRVGCSGC